MSKRPPWLDEFRRRTKLIDVIDAAFDETYTDKDVRNMLIEAAQDLGELFLPESSTPGGGVPSRLRKRKR